MTDAQTAAREEKDAEQRSAPSGKVVYKAIYQEGADELQRPTSALFWSGLAAGLSMSFSLIAEGLLQAHLPDAPWRPLITKLGYGVGFLIVILGRQQLFTENTLTPILPLLIRRDGRTLLNVLRLWVVVLAANLLGGLLVAWGLAQTGVFPDSVSECFREIGREHLQPGFELHFTRAIFAGWLIALMIWLLPFAETGRVWVILLITYVVGLGEFSHIIAGSIPVFLLAASGEASWGQALLGFNLPTLLGNIVGGVMLVAVLNHAQVVAGAPDNEI